MSYTPPEEILVKYADLIVNFSLNKGNPIEKGDVMLIEALDYASPFIIKLSEVIEQNGAKFLLHHSDDYSKEDFLQKIQASNKFIKVATSIKKTKDFDTETDKSFRKYKIQIIRRKNEADNLDRCICLYPSEYMAQIGGVDLKTFWNQIKKACYLEEPDPIEEYKKAYIKINKVKKYLNELDINYLSITGNDVDLQLKIGSDRKWIGATYRNIPSFEIYTSPDYRGSNGWIKFNTPNHVHDKTSDGVFFRFKDGELIDIKAEENHVALKDYLSQKNMGRIGEVSFTDKRISKIDKVLNNSLYDENFGGNHGNMHLGMGRSYPATLENHEQLDIHELDQNGLNSNCVFHNDYILRSNFRVIANLSNGEQIKIYENGTYKCEI